MKNLTLILIICISSLVSSNLFCQDTVKVQTFSYTSLTRDTVIEFPSDPNQSYEKIIMSYNMRCHDATVSGSGNNWGPHQGGCGEWDYSCNTYITDSARVDSILSYTNSHSISGFSGTTYNYSNTPTYTYTQTTQKNVVINSSTPTSYYVNSGASNLSTIIPTEKFSGKTQILFTATELLNGGSGLSAGDIHALDLDVSSVSSDANFMRIRLLATSKTTLDPNSVDVSGFTEVYYSNTTFVNGTNNLAFHTPFNWNGTDNLIVEITFTNSNASNNTSLTGGNSGFTSVISSSDNNYTEFSGSESLEISTAAMTNITNELTVSAWLYGDASILPANTYFFEAKDAAGNRTANVHLPWSNGSVYWDCGNSGTSYDRIDKAANTSDYEGQWNHWAFVKNVTTGTMKMYLNGTLWHTGTGKTLPIDISTFEIGKNAYYGYIDEFRVWDKELNQTEIQEWMNKSIDASHPDFTNLVAYYKLDEGTGNTSNDASANALSGSFTGGGAIWRADRGDKLKRFFETSSNRPNIRFYQGTYNITVTDVTVLDSLQNAQNKVVEHSITNNFGTKIDDDINDINTIYHYPSGTFGVFDEDGNQLSTKSFPSNGSITISELEYYRRYPSKYELLSLVTPYGNGLDLGQNGKTFLFDVTDYTPILKNKKRINIEGGNWQEELDVKFYFIEGTPTHEVKNIQQIWRGSQQSFANINSERVWEDRDIKLDASASSFKIRSAITGHGQEGEFISRQHSINIDGGSTEFTWNVWKECAENPIYPQGGSWIFDRAGWCPGMATDIQESVLDEYVSPGNTISVDYNISTATGDSRYIANHQLVTYGPANFTLDARIIDVKRPNNVDVAHGRFNPACNLPIVVIQNSGSTTLTSLKITYNVKDGSVRNYNWIGNLEFLETEEVELPVDNISFWDSGSENIFEVTVSLPNGGSDEYALNNSYNSMFTPVDRYDNQVQVKIKTNNFPNSNNWKILDNSGNIVVERDEFTANTTHLDELWLSSGCYTFILEDSNDDGLYSYFSSNQGTGNISIREGNSSGNFTSKKTLNPDFGGFVRYDFYTSAELGVEELESNQHFSVYPNPTSSNVIVELNGYNSNDLNIEITNQLGQVLHTDFVKNISNAFNKEYDLSNQPNGIYIVKVIDGGNVKTRKIIKQ